MPGRTASPVIAPPGVHVATRFFPLSAKLIPYVSAIYMSDIAVPAGERIEDYLHPEWANLRFIDGEAPIAAIGDAAPTASPRFTVTGPTSHATYFAAGNMRVWGIGILPMGWAKFIPLPADDLADRSCDGAEHPAFAAFAASAFPPARPFAFLPHFPPSTHERFFANFLAA